MKISKRIKKIIEYIDVEDKVADVGCDHGYLCLGCIEKGISFVQNIDNKSGPLETAKRNLREYEEAHNIIYTLSDGLDDLDQQVDTVVISGMGGDLITQIIDKNLDKAKKLKKLIIIAHTKVPSLREALTKNFQIVDEDLVEDNDKMYEIIIFKPYRLAKYNYEDILLGPILKKKKSALFLKKIKRRLVEIDRILMSTTNSEVPALIKEKECIEGILKK